MTNGCNLLAWASDTSTRQPVRFRKTVPSPIIPVFRTASIADALSKSDNLIVLTITSLRLLWIMDHSIDNLDIYKRVTSSDKSH